MTDEGADPVPLVVVEKGHEWREVCTDAIRERRDDEALAMLLGQMEGGGHVAELLALVPAVRELTAQMTATGFQHGADPTARNYRIGIRDSAAAARAYEDCAAAIKRIDHHVNNATARMTDVDRVMANRGYIRIGRIDSLGERSLWFRHFATQLPLQPPVEAIELRAGRNGEHVITIGSHEACFRGLLAVLNSARFAAEWEAQPGTTLRNTDAILDAAIHVARHWSGQDGVSGDLLDRLAAAVDNYYSGERWGWARI